MTLLDEPQSGHSNAEPLLVSRPMLPQFNRMPLTTHCSPNSKSLTEGVPASSGELPVCAGSARPTLKPAASGSDCSFEPRLLPVIGLWYKRNPSGAKAGLLLTYSLATNSPSALTKRTNTLSLGEIKLLTISCATISPVTEERTL